jgi:polyphosphate glucokinase
VIANGAAKTAANIDQSWIGVNVELLLQQATGQRCSVLNDADAAGLAEMRFGCGVQRQGTVLILTLGTGIGSALFYSGQLYPNSELGHLQVKGMVAEHYASAAVRENQGLSWKAWAKRLNKVLQQIERILSPELMVFGGGVSRKHEKFFPYLIANAELQPAQLRNQAGIIGAACRVAELGR